MTQTARKTTTTSFSLEPSLLDALRELAEERGTSASSEVRAAIERHLFEAKDAGEIAGAVRVSAKLLPDPYIRPRNMLAVQFQEPPHIAAMRPSLPKRPAVMYLHGFVGLDLSGRPWSEAMYERFVKWIPAEVARLWTWEAERVQALGLSNGTPRFGHGLADPRHPEYGR